MPFISVACAPALNDGVIIHHLLIYSSLPLFMHANRNFEKFLVDANGQAVKRYSRFFPTLEIAKDIDSLLAGKPL